MSLLDWLNDLIDRLLGQSDPREPQRMGGAQNMSLLDSLKNLIDKDKTSILYLRIDPGHTDLPANGVNAVAGQHYFRLRLTEMSLSKQVQWFTSWYPAVHSLVRFDFGNAPVEIPNIADSTKVGMKQSGSGDVVARNFMLTPTMPFNGGVVVMDAGLIAVKGENFLNNFIQVLGGFASLLNVPQLSTVLDVARPLANGMQELLGAGDGRLHLGLHDSFSADQLKPGYLAIVRATEQQVAASRLWVVGDQLRQGSGLGQSEPFTAFDYMLFRIEIFENRDDWEQLGSIQAPFREALNLLRNLEEEKAQFYLREALLTTLKAPELTSADRRRAITSLKEQFEQAKKDFGVAGLVPTGEARSLSQAINSTMSASAALDEGEPTLEEILSS